MQKLIRYLNRRQWAMIAASIAFIVVQVWLDLKLPDYMSSITTLVQTEGSAMADILIQGGYMLLCALGSGVASVIVGYFAAQVAAGLAMRLRGRSLTRLWTFLWRRWIGSPLPASSTAPPTTSHKFRTWLRWASRPS